jgi:hypothetical protein
MPRLLSAFCRGEEARAFCFSLLGKHHAYGTLHALEKRTNRKRDQRGSAEPFLFFTLSSTKNPGLLFSRAHLFFSSSLRNRTKNRSLRPARRAPRPRARHHGLGALGPLRPDLPPGQLCLRPGKKKRREEKSFFIFFCGRGRVVRQTFLSFFLLFLISSFFSLLSSLFLSCSLSLCFHRFPPLTAHSLSI